MSGPLAAIRSFPPSPLRCWGCRAAPRAWEHLPAPGSLVLGLRASLGLGPLGALPYCCWPWGEAPGQLSRPVVMEGRPCQHCEDPPAAPGTQTSCQPSLHPGSWRREGGLGSIWWSSLHNTKIAAQGRKLQSRNMAMQCRWGSPCRWLRYA